MQKTLRITSPHNLLLQNYSISAQQISHKVEWPKALEAIVIFIVPTSGKGQRIKDGIWQVEMIQISIFLWDMQHISTFVAIKHEFRLQYTENV